MCAGHGQQRKALHFRVGLETFRKISRPSPTTPRPISRHGAPCTDPLWRTAYNIPPPQGFLPTTLSNPLSYPLAYARALTCGWFPPSSHSPIPGAFPGSTPSSSPGHRGFVNPSPILAYIRGQAPIQSLPVLAGTHLLFSGQRADYPTPFTPSPSPTSNRLGGHGNTGLRLSRTPPFGLYHPSPLGLGPSHRGTTPRAHRVLY